MPNRHGFQILFHKMPTAGLFNRRTLRISDLHKQDAIKSNSTNSYLLRHIETIGLFFVKISSQIRHSYVEFDFEFVGFPVNDPLHIFFFSAAIIELVNGKKIAVRIIVSSSK